MVNPAGNKFSEDDRDELRQMGPPGWERLLRTGDKRNYPDPYGNGTSYYAWTDDGLYTRLTALCHEEEADRCPNARLHYAVQEDAFLFAGEADISYLVDPSAPASQERKV